MELSTTESDSTQAKAVSLISGGLDSLLATKVIIDQGVHVEGINYFTGFCVEGHTHAIRKKANSKQKRNNALWVAEQLGIKLHIIDISEEYKDIVINPKYGRGAHLNPCLDCKIFMVKKALDWMEEYGFHFAITGEVIGQRPMSQRATTIPIVSEESGAEGRLLRPLCAKNLPLTLPEAQGWVDRDQLFDFSGRSRKPQIALAKSLGFEDYAQPAGGCCFLTDGNYSDKLLDLWHNRGDKHYELDDIILLKVGRHIRPNSRFKLIISREEGESNFLEGYRRRFLTFRTVSHPGPIALVDGDANDEDLQLAARITARFCQGRDSDCVTVRVERGDKDSQDIDVEPMQATDIPKEWYL